MQSFELGILAVAALAACSPSPSSGPPATPEGPAAPVTASSATAPAAGSGSESASSGSQGEKPADSSPQGVDMRSADWSAKSDGVDGWLQSKGIQDTSSASLARLAGLPAEAQVECDRVVPIGKPVGEAALCRRQTQEGLWVLATSFLLLVPENGRLKKLWEAPSAVGLLSRVDRSETPYVQLNFSVQDDGALMFLEEVEGLACGDSRARIAAARKDSEPDEKDDFVSLERIAARVCQAKGRYAWRGSTFGR